MDTVKIGRSFVQHLGAPDECGNDVLAQAIISLGHNLNMRVIAEGVETATQLQFLKTHGCDEVQGFYFGEPQAAAGFAKRLGEKRRWHECSSTRDSVTPSPVTAMAFDESIDYRSKSEAAGSGRLKSGSSQSRSGKAISHVRYRRRSRSA
jgi:hypothetical protein